MRKSRFFGFLVMVIVFCTSCSGEVAVTIVETNTITPTVTITRTIKPSPTFTKTPAPTKTPYPTRTPFPTGTATPTQTPSLTATPYKVISPPPGLIYCSENWLWASTLKREPVFIAPSCSGINISPNGRYLLYRNYLTDDIWITDLIRPNIEFFISLPEDMHWLDFLYKGIWSADSRKFIYTRVGEDYMNDIWSIDITSKEITRLTNSPEIDESHLQRWDAFNLFIYLSRPKPGNPDYDPQSKGYLMAMDNLGNTFPILTDRQLKMVPQISPDGLSIVLNENEIYRWERGVEYIPFQQSGDYIMTGIDFDYPVWSPNNKMIAWSYSTSAGFAGLSILDLETHIMHMLHLHEGENSEGWIGSLVWSSDGRWLAYETREDDADLSGLWVMDIETREETHLGGSFSPEWSANGEWLLGMSEVAVPYGDNLWAIQTGDWILYEMDVPIDFSIGSINPSNVSNWPGLLKLRSGDNYSITEENIERGLYISPSLDTDTATMLDVGESITIISGMTYDYYEDTNQKWMQVKADKTGLVGWMIFTYYRFDPVDQ